MDRQQLFNRLHFNDQRSLNEEIDPESFLENDAFKAYRDWQLPLYE